MVCSGRVAPVASKVPVLPSISRIKVGVGKMALQIKHSQNIVRTGSVELTYVLGGAVAHLSVTWETETRGSWNKLVG